MGVQSRAARAIPHCDFFFALLPPTPDALARHARPPHRPQYAHRARRPLETRACLHDANFALVLPAALSRAEVVLTAQVVQLAALEAGSLSARRRRHTGEPRGRPRPTQQGGHPSSACGSWRCSLASSSSRLGCFGRAAPGRFVLSLCALPTTITSSPRLGHDCGSLYRYIFRQVEHGVIQIETVST